jgi:prolyl-tRNA synthetase
MIGGAIMTHGDDDGMIMPPRLAPSHVVILPIFRKDEERDASVAYAEGIAAELRKLDTVWGGKVEVTVDRRDINAGEKGWEWVKKGIPVRVEVGPRDIEKNAVFVARRDKSPKEKYGQAREEFIASVPALLKEMQDGMFAKAKAYRDENTREIDSYSDFAAFFTPKNAEKPEIHGGFAMSHWCGDQACEDKITEELSVTIRCIPFDDEKSGAGKCVVCGKESKGRVPFAKAY